jgi:acetyl esterase/lipase
MRQIIPATLLFTIVASVASAQQTQVVPLWPEGVPNAIANPAPEDNTQPGTITNVSVPTLTVFLAPAATRTGTAVVICPGGAYKVLAFEKEGTAIAEWFNTLGVSAFVLKYRVPAPGHPAPLQDVLRAIRMVRTDAAQWGVDPQRIGVMGFSAGGHLAASAANLSDDPAAKTGAALDATSARPDFQILVYPVITMTAPLTHAVSAQCLLGATAMPAMLESFSMQNRVTPTSPPAFLIHGSDDKSVPVENSVLYYLALKKAGVSAEMHVYQHGPHGVGMRPGHGPISDWPKRCEEWLRARGLVR